MQDQIEVIRQARRRYKRLLGMRKRGMTLQQIADKEGMTRQRASVLLKRAASRANGA